MEPLISAGPAICDWLTCSFPLEEEPFLLDDLASFLGDAGFVRTGERFESANRGSVYLKRMNGVIVASASGRAVDTLRQLGSVDAYLHLVGNRPHRVTRLDAACDWAVDAAPVVQAVYAAYRLSGVNLTQKVSRVYKEFSIDQYGRDTGTVYLGKRKYGDVSVRVYDKRHEQIANRFPDPGPWLRIEVESHVSGLTLRDAALPDSVFYQYCPQSLVVPPAGVVPWVPQEGGFTVTRREFDPMEKMRSIVRNIDDLTALAVLAEQLPGEGLDVAVQLLRSEMRRRIVHRQARRELGSVPSTPPVS